MNRRFLSKGVFVALAALAVIAMTTPAWASSHREAPAITEDPTADNTDVYAWVNKGTRDKLYIVANWNPLEEPAGGPNFHKFSDNVRYEIHIARGGKDLFDVVTYFIRFRSARPTRKSNNDISTVKTYSASDPINSGLVGGHQFFRQLALVEQTYNVARIDWKGNSGTYKVVARNMPVAPPNIGPRTQAAVYKGALGLKSADKYNQAFIKANYIKATTEGGQVFAGPRDDGFYVDLGGIFDLANVTSNRGTSGSTPATDGVAGFNVHSIALEIPTKSLTPDGKAPGTSQTDANKTLGIWASASRRRITFRGWGGRTFNFGGWVQVSRLGFPLINEAIIGIQDKDRYNASHPAFDVQRFGAYFLNPVVVRDAEAVGIYGELGADPDALGLKFNRTDIPGTINLGNADIKTIGDVLRVDMTKDSSFPNGRVIGGGKAANQNQADVTDVILSVVLSKGTVAITDNANHNDKDFLTEFPFLATPHEGFSGGHGKVTKPSAP